MNPEEAAIRESIRKLTGEDPPGRPVVWDDTAEYMSIERGHLVRLDGRLYLVRGNEHEGRFSIDDQPKFWVKRAIGLADGVTYILKLACREEFLIHVGAREVHCYRSPQKEARVLGLVRGDRRFMQGWTAIDGRRNRVHIIEFIRGTDLLSYLPALPMDHEAYAQRLLPDILRRIADSLDGIQRLHDHGLCHGDIRNDHLMVERESGDYRWIDFDLNEESPWFDVWSAGNVLHCAVGKGFVTFRETVRAHPELS